MTPEQEALREKVAREIYACEYDSDHYSLEREGELTQRLLRNQASAAIAVVLKEAARVADEHVFGGQGVALGILSLIPQEKGTER